MLAMLLCCVYAQTAAQPVTPSAKYFLFFKTWNFLKYYHPRFAGGEIEADSLFVQKLILLKKATSKEELNVFLVNMVDGAGMVGAEDSEKSALKASTANPVLQGLVNEKLLNRALKDKLLQIYSNRDTTGKYYVPALHYTTDIPHEKTYQYPAKTNVPFEMRLLALAKLQGVIDYLYPHTALIKPTWDRTIKEMVPLYINCRSRMEYEILLLKCVARLNDSHAYNCFYDTMVYKKEIFKNSFYPPFAYEVIDGKLFVTNIIIPRLCAEAGIKKGDEITAVNGQSIGKRIAMLSKLLCASNRNTLIYKLSNYLTNFLWSSDVARVSLAVSPRSGSGKSVSLRLIGPADKGEIAAINNYLSEQSAVKVATPSFRLIQPGTAYFEIDKADLLLKDEQENAIDAKMDSLLNLAAQQKGIIFDMRGYPRWGGLVYHYIYKKFSKPENLFAKYFEANAKNLGTFCPVVGTGTYYPSTVKPENLNYQGKVCIIVNAQTRSLSEWTTMNLQHIFPQAITIGEQTSGADGDEKHINLPGNYNLYFTGNAIYYPDGTLAQGKGVKIDRRIKPRLEDILNGKDSQLQYALDVINAK